MISGEMEIISPLILCFQRLHELKFRLKVFITPLQISEIPLDINPKSDYTINYPISD